jgi:hypothetical protein
VRLSPRPEQGVEDARPGHHGFSHREPALDAGLAAVDRPGLRRAGSQDPFPRDLDIQRAPHPAKRADDRPGLFRKDLGPDRSFRQRARGTDIDAGPAKLTAGFEERPVESRSDDRGRTPRNEGKHRSAADLVTDPDAPPAKDAEIVVPVEERIVPADLEIPVDGLELQAVKPDGPDDVLETAAPVLSAKDTAGDLSHLADGRFQVVALVLLRADQAGAGVLGKDQGKDMPAQGLELGSRRPHLQALLRPAAAGGDEASLPRDLDQAHPAAREREETRVVAKRRDVHPMFPRGLEDGPSGLHPDFAAVDRESHRFSVSPAETRATARIFRGQMS